MVPCSTEWISVFLVQKRGLNYFLSLPWAICYLSCYLCMGRNLSGYSNSLFLPTYPSPGAKTFVYFPCFNWCRQCVCCILDRNWSLFPPWCMGRGGGASSIVINCEPCGKGPLSNSLHPTNFSRYTASIIPDIFYVSLSAFLPTWKFLLPFLRGSKEGGDSNANVNDCPWFPWFWSFFCCSLLYPCRCVTCSMPLITYPPPTWKFLYTLYNGRGITGEIHLKIQMLGHDCGCLPCLLLSEAS